MSIQQVAAPFHINDFRTTFRMRLSRAIQSYNSDPNKGCTDTITQRCIKPVERALCRAWFNLSVAQKDAERDGFLTKDRIPKLDTDFSAIIKSMNLLKNTTSQDRLRDSETILVVKVFQELITHALNRANTAENQQQFTFPQPQMFPGPAPQFPQANQPIFPTPQAFAQFEPQLHHHSRNQGAGFHQPQNRKKGPRLARTRPATVPPTSTAPPIRTTTSPATSQTEMKQSSPPSASPSPLKSEAIPLDLRLNALPTSPVTIDVPPQPYPPQPPVNKPDDEKEAFYASGNRGETISTSAPPSRNLTPPSEESLQKMRRAVDRLRELDPGTFISAATVLAILQDPEHTYIPKVDIDSPAEGKGKFHFVPPSVLSFRLAPIQHLEDTPETIEKLKTQYEHTVSISINREYNIDDQVIQLPTGARTGRIQFQRIRGAILQIPKPKRNTELSVVEQDLIPTMIQVGNLDPEARIAVIYDAHNFDAGGLPGDFTPEGDLIRTTNAHLYLDQASKEGAYPIHEHADALHTEPLWMFKGLDGQLLKQPIPFTLISTPTHSFNPQDFPDGKVPVHTDEYDRNELSKHILSSLYAAHVNGATTLLITPLGCDGHWHDPQRVIRLFIQYLSRFFPGCFKRVCFTVPGRETFLHFEKAVKQAGGGSIQQ